MGYPPPYQDTPTLAAHLSVHENTVTNWVRQGILPPPRARGGKVLWKWAEVVSYMDAAHNSGEPDGEGIKNATRQLSQARDARRARHVSPRHQRLPVQPEISGPRAVDAAELPYAFSPGRVT